MAVLKCKMCGGTLELNDKTVAICDYCGTQQTVPKNNDGVISNLFNRANNLRLKCEFDKAAQIYEKIVEQDDSEAEAHWGIVLCKYGIEYVEDPKTLKRIPTCHRTLFEAVTTDADYLAAIDYSDAAQQTIYENEARTIDKIQKDILAIVENEKTFDVFICYKETDENGKRTIDSAIANDIYHQLTQEGFKVFFAAITLEDKLGQEYEPYIFAALNSAKVMLVLGTKPEYYSAIWVKNEWSRFLQLMKTDHSKLLIPCYRDMEAYDLPEEFAHLQAQDMSKIGFINDVVRGIKKVSQDNTPKTTVVKETVISGGNANTAPLLKRAFMFLEDGDWNSANEYCEKVLDIDPENASAYLGKLLSELRVKKQESLKDYAEPFDNSNNYQKAIRFADENLKTALIGYIERINTRNENARLDGIYTRAKNAMSAANTESAYKEAAHLFESVSEYQDSAALAQSCYEKAEVARKDAVLYEGKAKMTGEVITNYESAIKLFKSIFGWKDADEQIIACQKKIEEIKAMEEAKRLERERQAEIERIEAERKAKRNKKIAIIATPIVCVVIAFTIVLNTVIIPNNKYNDAVALMDASKFTEAITAFESLDGYKDSAKKINECNTAILEGKYNNAVELAKKGDYVNAAFVFESLDGYKDSAKKINECNTAILEGKYNKAVDLAKKGDYVNAVFAFSALGDFKDSEQQAEKYWSDVAVREKISAGTFNTIGLKSDGTVVAAGYNDDGRCDVGDWKDIVAVSVGTYHTVGLKSDGTVVTVRSDYAILSTNVAGLCDVEDWKDIVAVSAGEGYTVGLKSDGTVVAVGRDKSGECNVGDWKDIIAVSAGSFHTVGLKSDGTVVAVGDNDCGQCDVGEWEDIVAVAAGRYHTVGLKSDGTVVAVGSNDYGECNVGDWKDIVAVSAGDYHTVGLKSDGTVVAVGSNDCGQCDVGDWEDIVAVSAGYDHTVGLKSDGTVVAVGSNDGGRCNVGNWKGIKIPTPDKK